MTTAKAAALDTLAAKDRYVCTNQKYRDMDDKVKPCGATVLSVRDVETCPRCGAAMAKAIE